MESPFASHEERIAFLERVQLLHDSTLRRHGEMLDTHAVSMARLEDIAERLQRTMQAVIEMLGRGNGR